jgi:uncharacterized protein (DUF1499 family)
MPLLRLMIKLLALAAITAVVLSAGALLLNRLPWSDPPGASVRLRTYLSTNIAETRADSIFPELRPRRYPVAPEDMVAVARAAMQGLGWTIVAESTSPPRLSAVVTTSLLRFNDDVTVHIRPDNGGSAVEVIARSRVGRGDLGANTRHVLDLQAALDAAVAPDAD